jgi:mRNA-degrading endonuclease RelE of RelBE toxin-antitoxin system
MMQIKIASKAIKQYKELSPIIKRKADKQFEYLLTDFRHPSLHAKKYNEQNELWQARIDINWRFYFYIIEPNYIIISVIKHPK